MSKFPGLYNFNDVVKFKIRGRGVVTGYIVGVTVNRALSEKQEIIYQVHSTKDISPSFHFKNVSEKEILNN